MPDEPEEEVIRVEFEKMNVGGLLAYKNPKIYSWEPKPDITTFELAQCLPAFFGAGIEDLPPECLRHFQEEGTSHA